MPKTSLHVLAWSEEHQSYELRTQGHLQQRFRPGDEQRWQEWVSKRTSFAFQRQHQRMSIIKEARPRGAGYWYAYSTLHGRNHKRYLGQTSSLTLERLEREVTALVSEQKSVLQQIRQVVQSQPGSPHLTSQGDVSLLGTKYIAPQPPAALVKRERLLKDLDLAFKHRLLLLSSSAGSGKTTLLSEWLKRSSHNISWLSLDELDNDPIRFWTSVIAALRTHQPTIGNLALAMLYTPQPPPLSTVLITLINELLSYSNEIILILDDYHVIEDRTIQDTMAFLLDHCPANLHLIISSRVDPPFLLARWRIRGQLAEIRESDIRFTLEETNNFLNQGMELSLTREEIALLESRTEGWIAGLQMAALSLRTQKNPSSFVQGFTGGERFILDYMQEEIFQRQPLAVQHFLLQVSVLSRMNAALCQSLTEESASQELLETLERNNLFVVPLDEQRQWYRLHSLFREALLARLQAIQPGLVPCLHQRAANWYETHGYIHEAMSHALLAKDYSFAALIMERAAGQLWMKGEAKTISAWVLQLPIALLRAHSGFAFTSALNLLSSTQFMPEQQRTEALTQLEQIIGRVELASTGASLPQAEEMKLSNRIRLLREFVLMGEAFRKGDMPQVRQIARRMQPLAADESVDWKWYPLYGLFVSAQLSGDSVLLLPELLAMKQQAFQEQNHAIATIVMCWIAAAFLYAGDLRSLQRECLQVQDLLDQSSEYVSVAAYPAFDLSFFYYERNQLEQAESSLQGAIKHAARWQDMNLLVWSYATCVKVFLASGKLADAEEALQQASKLMQEHGFIVNAPAVTAAKVSLWLALGDLSAAETWAAQYIFDVQVQDYTRHDEYEALARVYLALQQYERCLQLLEPLLRRMERVERKWDVIHLLALQIVALHGLGDTAQAQQVLLRLLALTEAEGYIRVYMDAGTSMRELLKSLLNTLPDHKIALSAACTSYISTLLAAFEQKEHRRSLKVDALRVRGEKDLPASSLTLYAVHEEIYEPLSPQEQKVLSLLVVGRTYAEIAQELIVSPNTIKTQVSSIYRKLGVSRRAEASIVAQHLHLL